LKFKQPFRYVVSCLRATGADTHAHQPLIEYLMRMGQGLFQYPTPDGYPDRTAPWLGTLLWRWNFAFALASNKIPSAQVSLEQLTRAIGNGSTQHGLAPARLLSYFIGRAARADEMRALDDYVTKQGMNDDQRRAELLGLILASPAFQRY